MTSSQASSRPTDALQTTYMAATRTLLAMVRTGAAISGGGAVVTNLLVKGWPRWVAVTLASAFVVLGYWLMWAALKEGRKLRAKLEAEMGQRGQLFSHRDATFFTVSLQLLLATVLALFLLRH